ncbi:MAG TPA: hypothetical protein VJK48_01530, partial [Chlamydiales bacterium]|nr:hypothetical protein [Chlamydiales bacterium]
SPLLHEWIEPFLRNRKVPKSLYFEDPLFDWVKGRVELPLPEEWWKNWAPFIQTSFHPLLFLYPTRGANGDI